jgi:ribosomal protein L37AE/L43A
MHLEICPICSSKLSRHWETIVRKSFTGLYTCSMCGRLRITGFIREHALNVMNYLPGCTNCGIDYMVPVGGLAWRCGGHGCGRVYQQLGSGPSAKIVLTWRPGMRLLPPITMDGFAAQLCAEGVLH